jgi:hypothetical protein
MLGVLIPSLATTNLLPLESLIKPIHLGFLVKLNQTTRWKLLQPPNTTRPRAIKFIKLYN